MDLAKRAAAVALFIFCLACEAQTARRFIVSAAHPLATEAGYQVLRRGGSAVDAAVAVQAMLGLVEPESSGIGGGAFMLHWSEGEKKLRTYDGRETAPAAARAERFMREGRPVDFFDAVIGGRSVGVPGVMRMLELAQRRHGRVPWGVLFADSIAAAEAGFPLSPRLHAQLERERPLRDDPQARAVFYDENGDAKPPGARIFNPAYGATLRAIAIRGADALHTGEIAADIVRAVRAHRRPGDLTEADLAGYRAKEREPLCGPFRHWRICSMAPPSSGGVAVLQILGLLQRAGIERAPSDSPHAVHLFAEAGKLAYADRARYLGDPDVVSIPLKKLLDPRYLDARALLIGERAVPRARPGDTESGTSHFSIVDAEGNAVAMTTTIESTFGSRIMVRGFLLNNQLTDFDFSPGSANQVGPGKRPRSSMAPTLVFSEGDRLVLALGSPGGSFIINFVAKTLLARLEWGLGLQAALDTPNFGSRNGPTEIERGSAYERFAEPLRSRGHEVLLREMTSGVHAIERVPGGWIGAADRRREGMVRGE